MHMFISSIIHIINTTTSSIISYIIYPIHRKYDPYPCILGIPVMPALFSTCKFYIFVSFTMIGTVHTVSIVIYVLACALFIDQ